ncbi:MAG TPA: taurine dioxygenase [Gammaproteobacteria bacterium]|nr:taurine dioxygenase [Gammaproteobacteria bacterium]|tara:strand:- start:4248 stop:5009 length:762 start_codon:yes stop_codon:yes gene_type:complete
MQPLQVEKLSGSLGGRVIDFDLSGLTVADFDQVADALWQFQVLVFKNQALSIVDHIEIGRQFGPLHTHPAANGVAGHPEVLLLRNRGKSKTITEVWHSDVSCESAPPSISILQAIELPPFGGDTIFANQYQALEELSPSMREMIRPLRAVHSAFEMQATHPVVRTHPETGREALYVNGGFTQHFEGMTKAESKPLLDYLVAWASKPDLTFRHNWSVGDIIIWDNRCVMHYAVHDYGDQFREMHRVTVQGEMPV